jgi:two-component system chemotaxis response regulator CheY
MGYNILIVDDSVIARSVIGKAAVLSDVGTGKIFNASNGAEALEILRDNWIDIVFCDINMPVMSGVEMIERMAEDGVTGSVPVVVVSSDGCLSKINRLKELGVREYIRKPFTPEEIGAALRRLLSDGAADAGMGGGKQ